MSGSTISNTVKYSVTLGSGPFADILTLTNTGTIAPQKTSGLGVSIPANSADTLLSYGVILAGNGSIGSVGTTGSTTALRGSGSPGGNGGNGGAGGVGVSLSGAGSFVNDGIVTAGAGGAGGTGGNGVSGSSNRGAYAGHGGVGGLGGTGVILAGTGEVVNGGTIFGGAGGAAGAAGLGKGGFPGAAGAGGYGINLMAGAVFSNTGLVAGGTGGTGGVAVGGAGGAAAYLNGATLINAGTLAGGAGGNGSAQGNNGAAVSFGTASALLVVEPGASFIGNVVANGTAWDVLELSGTSSTALASIGTQFQNFSEISFASGADWTIAGDSAGLATGVTITGFAPGDVIDLTDFIATAETYVSGVGLVVSNASLSETIQLSGSFAAADFTLSQDGGTGTLIQDVNCFARGTRITTAKGQIPVEELAIGTEVINYKGERRPVKWIGRRRYITPFANHVKVLPVCIKAGAIAPGVPTRDLLVSPGHAIYVSGALIHAVRLVNGVSIIQLPYVDDITYYHVELDSHEIILAENCPAETFIGEHFRAQFENEAEFRALYPAQMAPEQPCLPLLEQGFRLQKRLDGLARRAGLHMARRTGVLRGFVDQAGPEYLTGWAQDMAAPEQPVCLEVFAGEHFLRRIIANLYREDLRLAGLGSGNHAFSVRLLPELAGPLTVRRRLDNAVLPYSGVMEHVA